jgi:hypothetical protein
VAWNAWGSTATVHYMVANTTTRGVLQPTGSDAAHLAQRMVLIEQSTEGGGVSRLYGCLAPLYQGDILGEQSVKPSRVSLLPRRHGARGVVKP